MENEFKNIFNDISKKDDSKYIWLVLFLGLMFNINDGPMDIQNGEKENE